MFKMKVLVTGCAGFIGSTLCERLLGLGYAVIGIDNFDKFYDKSIKLQNLSLLLKTPGFTFYETDICDRSLLMSIPEEGIDAVIHLAAKAGVRPSILNTVDYVDVNIHGTLNLLDFMRKAKIKKMVFASSSSVYGNNALVPYKEDDDTSYPVSPYAFTKKSGELLLYNYFDLYHIDSVALRFFTVYGPRQRPDLAIHKFYNAIVAGEPIPMYGDGSTSRDYTFIEDTVTGVVNALDYLMRNDNICEIFNLGNSSPVALKELIRCIEKVVGQKAIINEQPMQMGDVFHTCADISKAQRSINYTPAIKLYEGLMKFHEWKQRQASA